MEVQSISANIDKASGSSETPSVALEANRLERHACGKQQRNCGDESDHVEHSAFSQRRQARREGLHACAADVLSQLEHP